MGLHENLQPVVWGVTIPFIVLTGVSCLLRFYARASISKSFGIDDWFMVGAFWAWLATQAILAQMIVFGGGKDGDLVDPANIQKITLLLFIIEFVYIFTQWLIKMSFLFFYLRVLATTLAYRNVCYVVIAFTCCQTIAVLLFYGLQCIPLDTFFHPELHPEGHCISTPISLYIPASLNVLTDVLIYVLPIYPIWQLQMSSRRRLGLIVCFTIGGGTVLVSLLRFIVLKQFGVASRTFYVYGSLDIVTTIELATAIITANMPGMRAVWLKHVSKTGSLTSNNQSHQLGTISAGQSRARKGGVMLSSRDQTDGFRSASEEELFYKDSSNIMVSRDVEVTTATARADENGNTTDAYYQFPIQTNVKK